MLHESGNTFGALLIDSNGNVVPVTATGGSATIDGIRFIATPQ
jgi:isoaspartyl peptidase/L-asparaginase-like protein (Ntn-hydrolase superfamily)